MYQIVGKPCKLTVPNLSISNQNPQHIGYWRGTPFCSSMLIPNHWRKYWYMLKKHPLPPLSHHCRSPNNFPLIIICKLLAHVGIPLSFFWVQSPPFKSTPAPSIYSHCSPSSSFQTTPSLLFFFFTTFPLLSRSFYTIYKFSLAY